MANQSVSLERGGAPLYRQLANILRERIMANDYETGQLIPTEPNLCEEFDVSRITVRQAIAILENEGMVSRQQGRGTFVTDWHRRPLGWSYGRLEDTFFLAKQTRLELTKKKRIPAAEGIANDLGLAVGTHVYSFAGIRHIQNRYRASYRAFVVAPFGRDIPIKSTGSQLLYVEVEKASRQRIERANQFIYATAATAELADEMGIPAGHPLLVTKRVYLNGEARPLMFAVTHFPGDAYQSISILERR